MNIGKTIAELRKANNMTQSEVADILGVSYQAVSKWERDESLPDITMLPKIADLYHISIDHLLRGSFEMKDEEVQQAKEIVEEAAQDDLKAFESTEEQTSYSADLTDKINQFVGDTFATAFENLAPFMKPKKIHKVLNKRNIKLDSFSKSAFEYFDSDTIDRLIDAVESVDQKTFDELLGLLPTCNSSSRNKIVQLICQSDMSNLDLCEIFPFLNKNQINVLLEAYFEKTDRNTVLENLEEFLPFVNHDGKDKILDYLLEGDINDICLEDYMPFLSADHKDRLVSWIISQNGEIDFEEIFPFLNSPQKKKLLNWASEYMDFDDLSEFAPFLDKETIRDLVEKYIEEESDDDLKDFYPFMNHETVNILMNYYIENKMNDELIELLPYIKQNANHF